MPSHLLAFVSLFLGLVLGPQRVELAVEGNPAVVELALDGRPAGRLIHPPWAAEVNLGTRLEPHLLEATARDAGGAVVGQVRQWLNLPREPAEAALVVETAEGGPRRARLVWHHLAYDTAEAVNVTLDGASLPLQPDGSIALPPFAGGRVHLLASELRFPDGSRYTTELALGPPGAASTSTEITGVPVHASRLAPPTVASLDGRLREDGAPLQVSAVEKAPARVVMVLDESARVPLFQLAQRGGALVTPRTAVLAGDEVHFLFPRAEIVARKDLPSRLFTMTQAFTRDQGSFGFLLTHVRMPPPGAFQRLTDALAVAALQAAAGSRARAVVLVLGPEPKDESAYGVEEVRRFLADLHVPLLVWTTGRPSDRTVSDDRIPLTSGSRWGEARDVGSVDRLLTAVEQLRDVLDDQYTVWVDGSHLPQRITVDAGTGVTIVGAG